MTSVAIIPGRKPSVMPDPIRVDLFARIAENIEATRSFEVLYQDVLGEGQGAWHPGDRYPTSQVNCMIWLQLVLAEAYGRAGGQPAKQLAMDCLRYYGGQVGFSMRKHYLEQWLAFDPGPLRAISLSKLCASQRYASVIEPKVFLARREFELPLYNMGATRFETEYAPMLELRSGVQLLPPGFYVTFAVPTRFFFERFADRCGPLGLVHCAFLEVDGWHFPAMPHLSLATVHHASILSGAVLSEPLEVYLEKSVHIHQGYVICELDPAWIPALRGGDDEARVLLWRESQLGGNGFRPFMGF